MNISDLIAIDVHTHAEVSCRQPADEVWQAYETAATKYFKADKRLTIAETVAHYRQQKIGLVMFTVDSGNSDIMIAFASIDPHKGKMGVREARRVDPQGQCGQLARSRMRRAHDASLAWAARGQACARIIHPELAV
ncbi:MAG TPA: hypothetical protein VGE92_12705 [Steroidobacteraceae bacterium]|jgi:hypothetical protein